MPRPPVDPQHWLYRLTAHEWVRAALSELARAESAIAQGDRRAGLAGCRRAAGMGLNAWLACGETLDDTYGRTFMEHLHAVAEDTLQPETVRRAARVLRETSLPGGSITLLHTRGTDRSWTEAARDLIAHGYAHVVRTGSIDAEPTMPSTAGDAGNEGDVADAGDDD